ncbi:MAG TPA: carboxypeptidase-like regulatory domain-containing protein [Bacteroidales bacterium]|nr:carboxypeptidase-like regulatory domain-containing protein [Bacteroidales bacterium]
MKTQILSLAIMLVLSIASISPVFSQAGGTIKGTLINSVTKDPVPLANVYVKYGENLIGAQTDFDGNFTIKPVPSGVYSVNFQCVGYTSKIVADVRIVQDKITFLNNVELIYGVTIGDSLVVDIYGDPIIDPETPNLDIITHDQLDDMVSYKSINKLASITGSDIQVSDDDSEIYFRGSRSGDALYIIDGMRMINPGALCPSLAIGSMSVYTGGVPAKYGDFTGGVIVIETQSYFEWLAAQESERLRNGGF